MDGTLGEIRLWAALFAPRCWLFCNGAILAITEYAALYSLLGTMYGGDGRSTFALPDLRGRVPIGVGQGTNLPAYTQGQTGGRESVTLSAAQIPPHQHGLACSATQATQASPANAYPNAAAAGSSLYADTGGTTLASQAILNTGANSRHENMMPCLTTNYIICANGMYPSRS